MISLSNKWVSLGAFRIKPPFGTDSLQVIASTTKIDKIPEYEYDNGYYIISKNINKALTIARGIGRERVVKNR